MRHTGDADQSSDEQQACIGHDEGVGDIIHVLTPCTEGKTQTEDEERAGQNGSHDGHLDDQTSIVAQGHQRKMSSGAGLDGSDFVSS